MSPPTAFVGARLFDGQRWHDDAALVCRDGRVEGIAAARAVPRDADRVTLAGGVLTAGFVDLQVNGGGGLMMNDRQDVETIRAICRAHARRPSVDSAWPPPPE